MYLNADVRTKDHDLHEFDYDPDTSHNWQKKASLKPCPSLFMLPYHPHHSLLWLPPSQHHTFLPDRLSLPCYNAPSLLLQRTQKGPSCSPGNAFPPRDQRTTPGCFAPRNDSCLGVGEFAHHKTQVIATLLGIKGNSFAHSMTLTTECTVIFPSVTNSGFNFCWNWRLLAGKDYIYWVTTYLRWLMNCKNCRGSTVRKVHCIWLLLVLWLVYLRNRSWALWDMIYYVSFTYLHFSPGFWEEFFTDPPNFLKK